jgi:NAD(P)-dependent dehydrogenase (short-subunit alcohol dehydrogenase family)
MADTPGFHLQHKVALVTGAGHGIGAGIADALAQQGASIVVNDRDEDLAVSVAAQINESGGNAIAIPGDVSSVEDVDHLLRSALEAMSRLDILVNNAAIFCNKPFLDHTVEDWDRLFAVNVRGVFLCIRAVLPHMIERQTGSIVNIASISAFNTTTEHVAYAASKAAVVTLTRDIATEMAPFGIRVNAVAPGPIDSSGVHSEPFAGVLLDRVGRPGDIGNAVAFLVSDSSGFITGETLSVAGGSDLKVDR